MRMSHQFLPEWSHVCHLLGLHPLQPGLGGQPLVLTQVERVEVGKITHHHLQGGGKGTSHTNHLMEVKVPHTFMSSVVHTETSSTELSRQTLSLDKYSITTTYKSFTRERENANVRANRQVFETRNLICLLAIL